MMKSSDSSRFSKICHRIRNERRPLFIILGVNFLIINLFVIYKALMFHSYDTTNNFRNDHWMISSASSSKNTLYLVTPTYTRPTQLADLTRMFASIGLATTAFGTRIHWIVIEDAESRSSVVSKFLSEAHLQVNSSVFAYTHKALVYENTHGLSTKQAHCFRGCPQRNAGLEFIAKHSTNPNDVVYLADDDNVYDSRLFSELVTKTTSVSTFPVGFTGHARYQRCVVDSETGLVTGFMSRWGSYRKFLVDMAGFAFTVSQMSQNNARFIPRTNDGICGNIEGDFVSQIAEERRDLQPLLHCTIVWVWHTKLVTPGDKTSNIPWDYNSVPRLNALNGEEYLDSVFDKISV